VSRQKCGPQKYKLVWLFYSIFAKRFFFFPNVYLDLSHSPLTGSSFSNVVLRGAFLIFLVCFFLYDIFCGSAGTWYSIAFIENFILRCVHYYQFLHRIYLIEDCREVMKLKGKAGTLVIQCFLITCYNILLVWTSWVGGDNINILLVLDEMKIMILYFFIFQMPKIEFRSNAKPSLYAYPKPLKKEKETLKEKVRWYWTVAVTMELKLVFSNKLKCDCWDHSRSVCVIVCW